MTKDNKKNYVSYEVNDKVDLEIQTIIWDMHELLKEKRKDKMSSIQWFNIFKLKDYLVINNQQHDPVKKDKLKIMRRNLNVDNMTILIIEGVNKQVMLMSTEYKKIKN